MKRIVALIIAFVSIFCFASCNKNKGNGKTELTVSVFNGGYDVQWINALKERFEEQNEGVTVKVVEAIGNTGRQRQVTELRSGASKTDIYFCSNDIFTLTSNAKLEVDGVKYDSFVADLTDVYEYAVTGGTVADVMTDSFEEFYNYNGKYYALPWSSAAQGLAYHEKMLNENGWSVPGTTNELIALAKSIKSKGLTNEYGETVYPFSYCLEDEYWNLMFYPWIAQYAGLKGWNDYWAGKDAEGNVNNVNMLDFIGIKKALIVMDTLLKESNGFQHPSSKSKDFTSMQYRFLDGESVMVPNGDWLINEMKEGYSEQEIANLDVKLMKTPVISSISENLSYYNEDKPFDELTQAEQAEYDAILSQIVKDVDAGKQSSDVCSEADFERVKEARMMIPSEGNVHLAVVPSYCDQADLAKSFLKLMYSEEGAKIFARETLGCRLPMKYSFTTESDGVFSNSVNSVSDGATWIFKYNYKTELFTKYGLRILAPNVSNFVQLMSASNSNDYKGAYSIYNESKTYFENRWEEMVK
ncbi:MAG: extracellular solute-binding protein [Clostridia bacterium]|nr:extracellular solute-binding protein [Clostridia bacterium]